MPRSPHLLLVEAPYYAHIAALLRQGAERALAAAGATHEIVTVPGAFEIPAAVALAARICAESARGLQDLAIREGLAIGYGILTVENEAQALLRAAPDGRDKGGEAVRACLALVALKRRFAAGGG